MSLLQYDIREFSCWKTFLGEIVLDRSPFSTSSEFIMSPEHFSFPYVLMTCYPIAYSSAVVLGGYSSLIPKKFWKRGWILHTG